MTCSATTPFINQFAAHPAHSYKIDVRCTHFSVVVVVMAHFKIPTIKTKPRKKISIDGLSEFQWNEIEAKVEIRSGSFGVAYKADFNGNTVVAKRLRSERPAEIALFAKEGRLLSTLHHENVIEIKGCCFSPCALMLSYQYFDFRPFGIEKEVNNLLQFLEVVDSFEETSLAVLSPTVQKITQGISRVLTYLHDQDVTHRDLKPGNVLVSNGHNLQRGEQRASIKCL